MCYYCDCRRIPEIADLGAERQSIQDLADEVLSPSRAGSPEPAEAIERLRRVLDPHVARGESGVFAQAKEAGLASYYVDNLEHDHRRSAAALAQAGLDTSALQALFDDLHRHIAIEEYVFPAASQALVESQWEANTVGA